MAMVPAAGAMQQQLGDDDERQAKQLALQRDAETRLAALGTGGIQKPKDTLAFLNNLVYKKVGGQQLTGNVLCISAEGPAGIMYNTYYIKLNIYYVFCIFHLWPCVRYPAHACIIPAVTRRRVERAA